MFTTPSIRRRGVRVLVAAAFLAASGAISACDSASGAPASDQLSVVSPAAGATVGLPFTVRVQTGSPLGTTDTGRHHIHIWFDGHEDQYQISYTDTAQVTDAPAGAHTMTVSLRNADHSDAGPRIDVPLTIGGAGSNATTDPNGY
jgi:hypothetical protein